MISDKPENFSDFREWLHEVIFEADTKAGKIFDEILLVLIILSVFTVIMETVDDYDQKYHLIFFILEWIFTIIFTIEYALRLYCVYKPTKYATSFYGIVDLVSIVPTYLSLLITGTQYFAVIRAIRLLRVFRIFKLGSFVKQSHILRTALRKSRDKILVFLFGVSILVTIFGAIMYLIEGGQNEQFDSIPRSIYWAVVTLTTVGYGDIHPNTAVGQFVAALVMILGYAVIAVPTGIVTSDIINTSKEHDPISTQACKYCSREGHASDASYCKYCGQLLN